MKKTVTVIIGIMLVFIMSFPVFADLGEPEFENWYVVCGLEGFDYIDSDHENEYKDHLEPGTLLQVFEYNSENKLYLLIASDKNYTPKGFGFVNVTENELNRFFLDANKTVGYQYGQKLPAAVEGTVVSDNGIVLRQGPAQTFKSYGNIPFNTNLTYQYVYAYGGYNWGYVTYKGKDGWACIDYVQANSSVTQSVVSDIDSKDDSSEDSESEETSEESETESESKIASGFLSNTKNVIIICCLGTVVIALAGVVALLIIKQKDEDNEC